MKLINNLTDNAYQITHIVLDDGSIVDLTLRYLSTLQRWSLSIVYNDIIIKGQIICSHPNLLRKYKNIIPFGIFCTTTDVTEPVLQDDFLTGRALLYILNSTEVESMEGIINE